MKTNLSTHPVASEQMVEFLRLIREEATDYLDATLESMQLTWLQFVHVVETTGQVIAIQRNDVLVGFYWIEERERILHLHGLFIYNAYQGQGIGTEILSMLERQYAGVMDAIELGVHESNTGALALYERVGFRVMKHLPDLGYYIMQYSLTGEEAGV